MKARSLLVSVICLVGCTTWHGATDLHGISADEVACAKTFIVGGTARPGLPLVTMDPQSVERVARRIEHRIPQLRRVRDEAAADLVVSVIFAPSLPICTHCEPKPDTEWSAIVGVHSPSGELKYFDSSGSVWLGTDVVGGFVGQLSQALRSGKCGG